MDLAPGLEADLWERIRTAGDASAFEQMVVHYAGWATAIARGIHRRVPASAADAEDFVQNARVGLMEAVSRFDPGRGIPFPAFAKPRIRGAVFNGLRAILGERHRPVADAVHDERLLLVMESLGEDPFDRVIDAILGLGTACLLELGGDDDADPIVYAGRVETQRRVRGGVACLPDRQRQIVEQHYFRHVPFVDIANSLGLTKGRISQLHGEALRSLRAFLRDSG